MTLRHWWLGFVVTLVAVMVVALLPPSGGADWFPQADKLRHLGAFATLWWIGFRTRRFSPWLLACLLLGFGVAIEVAQSFTAYREASAWDVAADGVGILVGALLSRRLAGLWLRPPTT